MKSCKDCSQSLAVDAFYRTATGAPMHICKECHKARMAHRRRTNPAVQEYDRLRQKRLDRRRKSAAISKRWREEHPEAYRAQTIVGNALRDGKLVKGECAICGTNHHVHGHHRDYRRPLDIVWLCAKCHHRIHAAFPELSGHREDVA